MAESKSRLLYIFKYLWQNTDAQQYATTADNLAIQKGNGISCDRKTIPGDIAKLCDIGIDIEEERSRENRYSLSSHLFTLPELKLLIDAVESSKFITVKKSAELIEKLSQMTSIHQAAELKSNLYVSERVKPLNEQIYYLVDNINTAINRGKQISFRYFHYDQHRKEVPNNDGKRNGKVLRVHIRCRIRIACYRTEYTKSYITFCTVWLTSGAGDGRMSRNRN